MIFFSGFGFNNEKNLFDKFLINSQFNVAGFSYGAIKAFEYVKSCNNRIDTLQLFSPAFFHNKSDKFKQIQLNAFKKDKSRYLENFYKSVLYPDNFDLSLYKNKSTIEELQELLYYNWIGEELEKLNNKNVKIEVFIGKLDKIVDTKEVYKFFINYATVYCFNKSGHLKLI